MLPQFLDSNKAEKVSAFCRVTSTRLLQEQGRDRTIMLVANEFRNESPIESDAHARDLRQNPYGELAIM